MATVAHVAELRRVQRGGLGRQLIADAVIRALRIAEDAGGRGLMVSAIDKPAADYCEKLGFVRAKRSEDVFMLRLMAAKDVLGAATV